MTTRESHANERLQVRLFVMSIAVACSIALGACDDGLEPGQQMPSSSNVDAGERKDGGTTTSSNPSNARDGDGGDGARPMGGNASGGTAMGTAGGGTAGGGTAGGDGGVQSPSVQVAPACMGHGGETVCDGANLIRCGMAGNAESTTPCMNEARCRAGLMTGKCGSCDPGAAHCNGAELQECNANGEFVMKMPCPSAELCSEMNKSCNPMQCGADSVKCENGSLMRCKPDLTGFDMGMQCMSQALCSVLDKRCNECMPNTKVCREDTLEMCGADGKGPMMMPCSGTTPRCLKDKCVQCKVDMDCMTTMDCRVAKCNVATGMCTEEVAARGTPCSMGHCSDLLGTCTQCTENSHCSSSQSCVLGACIERAGLSVSSLFGSCSLTLNAGYTLTADELSPSPNQIPIRGTEFITTSFSIEARATAPRPLVGTAGTAARTYSVSGSYSGATSVSCSAQTLSDSSAWLTFTATLSDTSMTPPSPQRVRITAKR